MVARIVGEQADYNIENIIGISFTSGTLVIIYKKDGKIHTTQFTQDSLGDGVVNIQRRVTK